MTEKTPESVRPPLRLPFDISEGHSRALVWFDDRTGQEISWPEPLSGMFLLNKAKGIHKPQGLEYALSLRHSMGGPYEDAIKLDEGGWSVQYAHEGEDPDYYTNRAVRRCMVDQVPLGVVVQVKEKPGPRYRVLGLGYVVAESDRSFLVRQADSGAAGIDATLSVALAPAEFDVKNLADARERELRSIARRRGQPAFRKELLRAYDGACAISGCSLSAVLEAAHIIPYMGEHTNHITNGLLLRADLHTLFDLGLIAIAPGSHQVLVHASLSGSEYAQLAGSLIRRPREKFEWPNDEALRARPLVA